MTSPPPAPLRVVEDARVSPQATGVKTTLPLTFFDASWLFTGPVERLFFYSSTDSTAHFSGHHFPALCRSLSATLRRFQPLAGQVHPSTDPAVAFEIRYGESDSVPFTLAESDDDFHQISGSCARMSHRLNALVPSLPLSKDGIIPLLALQVTIFPGTGICLGVSIHHVACDDSSSIHFLKSWANCCRLGGSDSDSFIEPPPFFDRTMLDDHDGLFSKTLEEMQSFKAMIPPLPPPSLSPPNIVLASFSLSGEHIRNLKKIVLAATGDRGTPLLHCSTFVVACGFAWACLVKARGGDGKKRAHLLFSVDCRRRLRPPIPDEYFGNCLRPCFAEVDASELNGDGGAATASEAIGRAIEGMGESVLEGAEGWFQRILSVVPEGPMSVAGSPKFGVYDVDFGWGRPRKVEVVSIEKTPGTVSLAEDGNGEGGVQIGVALPEHDMDAFHRCFSGGLRYV